MSSARDSLADLEKHRIRLEEHIEQLRKTIQHWQTWDAEYEALKEEIEAISEGDETRELRRVSEEFEGELLKRKEIVEVIHGAASKTPRTKDQITNVLERRIDYVTKNIESLQKQLESAENKHGAAAVISQPDATDEDGQPITDIIEELDDDDNVVSYRLNRAGDSVPHVQAVLDKLDATDTPGSEPREHVLKDASETPREPKQEVERANLTPSIKKSVSFSDDTKPQQEDQRELSFRAKRVEKIMHTAKEQEEISKQAPTIPEDEDPEDAALRQEMLKYGMNEIGAVVAELQLEGNISDDGELDFMDDESYEDDGDEDEDGEDEYGRNGRVVTSQYRQRMLELERKLGIASRSSPKAQPAESDEDGSDDEGIGRIVVNQAPAKVSLAGSTSTANGQKPKASAGGKKGVRFAPSLDIAPEKESAAPSKEKQDLVDPLGDIVERSSSASSRLATPRQPSQKTSRFRKARDDAPPSAPDMAAHFAGDRPSAPSGPEGTTIASTLVERESTSSAVAPDDMDGPLAYQELADEYQRVRRKFIHRQGGFLREDESPVQPVVDEEKQEPMSRFKAARLSRQ